MMELDLRELGDEVTFLIKNASWFPYRTGHLKFDATSGDLINQNTYRIHFDGSIAPYVEALEEGTSEHDIFPLTRQALKFEINGKTIFAKKVHHPGSTKHKGFISEKSVRAIIDYIASKYNGEVTVVWVSILN